MPGYDLCEKQHKVGIKLMCPFVEKLSKFKKVCGSGPKSAQKNGPVMLNTKHTQRREATPYLYSEYTHISVVGVVISLFCGNSHMSFLVQHHNKCRLVLTNENSLHMRNGLL